MGVLIESDWNLKDTKDCIIVVPAGINRIRLEFKVSSVIIRERLDRCINRIRLEFKVWSMSYRTPPEHRINRIRLEFKDYLII